MTNNILSFPEDKIVRVPSADILDKLRSQGTKNFAEGFADEIATNLLMDFNEGGLDCEDNLFTKDFIFLTSALKALIYRSLDLEHPLQKIIDETMIEENHEEND